MPIDKLRCFAPPLLPLIATAKGEIVILSRRFSGRPKFKKSVDDSLAPETALEDGTSGDRFGIAIASWLSENGPAQGNLYHSALAAFEKPLFEYALQQTEGNQLRAAQLLGINRNTLRKRLADLDIAPEHFVRRH